MKRIPALFLFAALLACKHDPAPVDAGSSKGTAAAHGDTAAKGGPDTSGAATLRPACGEFVSNAVPPVALRYAAMARAIEAGQDRTTSFEAFWKLSDSARTEIDCHLMPRVEDHDSSFSDSIYQQIQSLLPLENITREEQIFAEPDFEKFQALARLRGTPDDTLFFHLLAKWFYRTNAWVWNQQDCDACWCDRIGDPAVVDGYLAFEGYLKTHGNRYGWFIRPRLRDLDTTFSRSHEACRSRAEETKGLRASQKRLPAGHPLRLAIDTLLTRIGKKDPAVTFGHEPGGQGE